MTTAELTRTGFDMHLADGEDADYQNPNPFEQPVRDLAVVRQSAAAYIGEKLGLPELVEIKQVIYKNGAKHLYGVYGEEGDRQKRVHIAHDRVLRAFEYEPKSPTYRNALRENNALKDADPTPPSYSDYPMRIAREALAKREAQERAEAEARKNAAPLSWRERLAPRHLANVVSKLSRKFVDARTAAVDKVYDGIDWLADRKRAVATKLSGLRDRTIGKFFNNDDWSHVQPERGKKIAKFAALSAAVGATATMVVVALNSDKAPPEYTPPQPQGAASQPEKAPAAAQHKAAPKPRGAADLPKVGADGFRHVTLPKGSGEGLWSTERKLDPKASEHTIWERVQKDEQHMGIRNEAAAERLSGEVSVIG